MKILYVTSSIIPSRQANSVHVMKMANALALNDNKVILIATDGKGNNGVDVYGYYNVGNRFELRLSKPYKKVGWLFRLFSAIKSVKEVDIIYTRWPLAAAVISKICKKKIILEYHTYPTNFLQKLILEYNIRINRVSKNIFITESLKKYFIEQHSNLEITHCEVLPDGADSDKEVTIKPIIEGEKIKCCYVGSFNKGKGVDTVIKISNQMKEVEFHIVGGNDEEIESYKSSAINENIRWYGHLDQNDSMKVLSDCHIALLPNKKNVYIDETKDIGSWTSPLKLFEYMAKGKAIIASDLLVLKEVLINERNCILVESENIELWVQAIETIQKDKELYYFLSENAKKDLDEKYNWLLRAEKVIEK